MVPRRTRAMVPRRTSGRAVLELCAAAKAGSEMRARQPLDTQRNRHSDFTGRLDSTSKMMSSGSETETSSGLTFSSIVSLLCWSLRPDGKKQESSCRRVLMSVAMGLVC
jgi:hypothetical protein